MIVRKILFILLMVPLIAAAVAAGVSFPVLLLMISLLFIALAKSSVRDEQLN